MAETTTWVSATIATCAAPSLSIPIPPFRRVLDCTTRHAGAGQPTNVDFPVRKNHPTLGKRAPADPFVSQHRYTPVLLVSVVSTAFLVATWRVMRGGLSRTIRVRLVAFQSTLRFVVTLLPYWILLAILWYVRVRTVHEPWSTSDTTPSQGCVHSKRWRVISCRAPTTHCVCSRVWAT